MAFIDDSDLKQPEPDPKAQVVYMQPPRGKLVPVLLVTLNLGVLGAVALGFFLMSGGKLSWPEGEGDVAGAETTPKIEDLDPELITTPNGRRLDLVQFGGYLFEVTRIAYSHSPSTRTVTITVPARAKGETPQQGIFHIGESFASGELHVVEISSTSVVLEHDGQQRVFPIRGAAAQQSDGSAPAGKSMIPPRNTNVVPDLPDGQVRAPRHPMADDDDNDDAEPFEPSGKLEGAGVDGTIDDLPDVRSKSLKREDYLELVKMLPDIFAEDFIFGVALERDTRMPYGLEIKNIAPTSVFFSYGIEPGDVIYAINGEPVTRVYDLDQIVKRNIFREEIRIDIEREVQVMHDGEVSYKTTAVSFVFRRGLPD